MRLSRVIIRLIAEFQFKAGIIWITEIKRKVFANNLPPSKIKVLEIGFFVISTTPLEIPRRLDCFGGRPWQPAPAPEVLPAWSALCIGPPDFPGHEKLSRFVLRARVAATCVDDPEKLDQGRDLRMSSYNRSFGKLAFLKLFSLLCSPQQTFKKILQPCHLLLPPTGFAFHPFIFLSYSSFISSQLNI